MISENGDLTYSVMAKSSSSVSELINLPTSGRWTWKDEICGLEFVSNVPNADRSKRGKKTDARRGVERVASSRGGLGRGRGLHHLGNGIKSKKDQAEHTTVLLEDIKTVAADMVFNVKTMPDSFYELLRTEQFDYFLLHLLSYFNCFFEKIFQENKKNPMYIEPSLSEKQALANAIERMQVAQKLLGHSYCSLLLGLGLEKQHHMECGCSRVSATYKDRSTFEIFYTFCTFVVWITFRRRDFDLIKKEIGRMLRSDTFNPAIRTKYFKEDSAESDEGKRRKIKKKYLESLKEHTVAEYRCLYPRRPPMKSIIEQRSPAIVALLPSPKEEATWLFDGERAPLSSLVRQTHEAELEEEEIEDRFGDLTIDARQFKAGILGEPFSLFNPQTLSAIGTDNDDEEHGEEGEKISGNEGGTNKSPVPDHGLSRQQTAISHATTDVGTVDET